MDMINGSMNIINKFNGACQWAILVTKGLCLWKAQFFASNWTSKNHHSCHKLCKCQCVLYYKFDESKDKKNLLFAAQKWYPLCLLILTSFCAQAKFPGKKKQFKKRKNKKDVSMHGLIDTSKGTKKTAP
jgi:hypothetical protein